jgi:transcriptional regulator with XRE-family HTH domain
MTANQVVAYNMAKARALRGWTQERVGEELAPYLGVKLSLKSISAMERSARQSERIRVFSADDLLALTRGFDLPLGFFLVAPPAQGIRFRNASADEDPLVLLDAVLDTPENLAEWEQALCECAAAMTPPPVAEWLRVHVARSAQCVRRPHRAGRAVSAHGAATRGPGRGVPQRHAGLTGAGRDPLGYGQIFQFARAGPRNLGLFAHWRPQARR